MTAAAQAAQSAAAIGWCISSSIHPEETCHAYPNLRTTSVEDVVRATVVHAMITLCGHELPLNTTEGSDGRDNVEAVMRWRGEIYDLVQNTVRFSSHYRTLNDQELRTKTFDIEIRTSTAFFQRFGTATESDYGTAKVLTIISDMGIVRDIHSSYELSSQLLVPLLEKELFDRNISNHIRVSSQSGFICVMSMDMLQFMKQRWKALDCNPNNMEKNTTLESCPLCPLWCRGSKGLWWHLQQQHKIVHSTATATANIQIHRDSTAIVVYNNKKTDLPIHDIVRPDESRPACKTGSESQDNRVIQTMSVDANLNDKNEDPWNCIKRGPSLEQFISCISYHALDCQNTRDKHGALMVHWAAGGGHLCILQYLLETVQCDATSTQLGQRAYLGRTALHWAARNGHDAVVQYLLERYLDRDSSRDSNCHTMRSFIDAETADGTTPFCWAAWQGHLSVMQLLCRYGCRVDAVNHFGCNAILWAAQGCGDLAVFDWLIAVGCPDWVVNHSSHGVLHKGAQRGRRDVCDWFMKRLTQWVEENVASMRESHSPTRLDLLKLWGPDNDGCTPSDLAGMEHQEELAIYLAEQEQRLIVQVAGFLSTDSDALPGWMSQIPTGSIYSDSQRQKHQRTWEPGAGVFRMRSVLSNLHG